MERKISEMEEELKVKKLDAKSHALMLLVHLAIIIYIFIT